MIYPRFSKIQNLATLASNIDTVQTQISIRKLRFKRHFEDLRNIGMFSNKNIWKYEKSIDLLLLRNKRVIILFFYALQNTHFTAKQPIFCNPNFFTDQFSQRRSWPPLVAPTREKKARTRAIPNCSGFIAYVKPACQLAGGCPIKATNFNYLPATTKKSVTPALTHFFLQVTQRPAVTCFLFWN